MTGLVPLTTSYAIGESTPPVRDITIGDLLREAADAAPDQLGLIEGIPLTDGAARRQWTYAELLADSERTARALLHRFEPGSHIAVWAYNIPEWELLEFGCALAGMVIVTVNPAFQRHELLYVLSQSKLIMSCSSWHSAWTSRAVASIALPRCDGTTNSALAFDCEST